VPTPPLPPTYTAGWFSQAYGAAVLILFFAGYFGARAFGHWDNRISEAEYVLRIQENRSFPFGHPGM